MARCESKLWKTQSNCFIVLARDVATGEHGSCSTGGKRRDKMSVRNIRLTKLVSRPYILNVVNVRGKLTSKNGQTNSRIGEFSLCRLPHIQVKEVEDKVSCKPKVSREIPHQEQFTPAITSQNGS